jgi:hypothetical protein
MSQRVTTSYGSGRTRCDPTGAAGQLPSSAMTPEDARTEIRDHLATRFNRAEWIDVETLEVGEGDTALGLGLSEFVKAYMLNPDEGRTHLDALVENLQQTGELQARRQERIASWEIAEPHLRLVLQHDATNEDIATVAEPYVDGVEVALALDLSGGTTLVDLGEMMEWGKGRKEVLAVARDQSWSNLGLQDNVVDAGGSAQVHVLASQQAQGASAVLFLDRIFPDAGPHGFLVGIPDGELVMVHHITDRVRLGETIGWMLPQVQGRFQNFPSAISDGVFWVSADGRIERVQVRLNGDQGTLDGSPRFMLLLASLPER